MANDAEPYIAAVADACQAAGLLVQGYDASGTRIRGGSIDLLLKPDPTPAEELEALRVLGWDEEHGWFTGRPAGSRDELTGLRFYGSDVLMAPGRVAAVTRGVLGGDFGGTRDVQVRLRLAGPGAAFDAALAAYAPHSCDVTAELGGTAYQCREHRDGKHFFAARWPACPAPWCRSEPGHRELHDIPPGTPEVITPFLGGGTRG